MIANNSKLVRRVFLKLTLVAFVVAATIPSTLDALAEQLPNEQGPFDVVILNGRVIDPESNFDGIRNVGVRDVKIDKNAVT